MSSDLDPRGQLSKYLVTIILLGKAVWVSNATPTFLLSLIFNVALRAFIYFFRAFF